MDDPVIVINRLQHAGHVDVRLFGVREGRYGRRPSICDIACRGRGRCGVLVYALDSVCQYDSGKTATEYRYQDSCQSLTVSSIPGRQALYG